MKLRDIRRLNLVHYINQHRTIEEFASVTGTNPKHISQIKNDWRGMGDRIASRIEKALNLRQGAMDRLVTDTDIDPRLVSICMNLDEQEMDRLEAFASGLLASRPSQP